MEEKSRKRTYKVLIELLGNRIDLNAIAVDDEGKPILTLKGNEQAFLEYFERMLRDKFFHDGKSNIKFESGIARIAYGELGFQEQELVVELKQLQKILLIISSSHSDEYDHNLNGLNFNELYKRFKQSTETLSNEEKERVNSKEYTPNGKYTIVKINSFEDAKKFYKYTNPDSRWCLTHMENMWDRYTNNGISNVYFAYVKDFLNIKPVAEKNTPLDTYGLSLISIIIDIDGDLAYCTCRWNHENGGSDSVMDAEQVSKVLGRSIFKFCPGKSKEELVELGIVEINNNGDLGLPSGTIWMTCNIGANSPEEYGDYYAWGETETKDNYSKETYKLNLDNNGEFQDVVKLKTNGKYRMPSHEEIQELVKNTKFIWRKYNGVCGGLFVGKNGNSIFIPAAGCRYYSLFDNVGSYCDLWSSNIDLSSPDFAWYLYFNSNYVYPDISSYRYYGHSVRGVRSLQD